MLVAKQDASGREFDICCVAVHDEGMPGAGCDTPDSIHEHGKVSYCEGLEGLRLSKAASHPMLQQLHLLVNMYSLG